MQVCEMHEGHVCQKQQCVYNGGTQHCKQPKEAHGNVPGSYRFVEGVGEAERAVTLMAEGLEPLFGGQKGINWVRHDEGQRRRIKATVGVTRAASEVLFCMVLLYALDTVDCQCVSIPRV